MRQHFLIAASALALAACGQQTSTDTADTTPAAPPAMQQATMSSAEFIQTAAASDAFEIQSSELAAQHAARQDVKDLASMLATAHRQTRIRGQGEATSGFFRPSSGGSP